MASISSLPDEIIISIMLQMPTSDAISLSRAYSRFEPLLSDSRLWRTVDLTACDHLSVCELRRLSHLMGARTRSLSLRGHVACYKRSCEPLLSDEFLRDLVERCPSLVHLRLEKCVLNTAKVSLSSLPSHLNSLSLSGSRVTGPGSLLSGAGLLWPRITQLELTNCPWLTSHSLLTLSKLPRLQLLCVRGCRMLGGEVAYSGIIGLLGFRQLRCLDVRRTAVDEADVASFLRLPELNSLLLEPVAPSVRLDGVSVLRSMSERCSRQLKSLALRRCHVSQLVLRQLPIALPALIQLDITGCRLSVDQVRQLKAQMPMCRIASDSIDSPTSSPSQSSPSPSPPPSAEIRPNKRSSEVEYEPDVKRQRREAGETTSTVSTSGCAPVIAQPCASDSSRSLSWCVCEQGNANLLGSAEFGSGDVNSQEEEDVHPEGVRGSSTQAPVVIVLNVFGADGGGGQPQARLARPDEVLELLHAVEPNRNLPEPSPRSLVQPSGRSVRDPVEPSGSSDRNSAVELMSSDGNPPISSGSAVRDPTEQSSSSNRASSEEFVPSIEDPAEQSGSSDRDPV